MAFATRRAVPIQLNYPANSLSERLRLILGKSDYSDRFDTTGIINLKWRRSITDGEKLKMKELLESAQYAHFVERINYQHVEKGLSRTSIVLRLLVSPDLI